MSRFRFSMRFCLVAFAAAGILLGLVAKRVRHYQQVSRDVKALDRIRAVVDISPAEHSLLSRLAADFHGYPDYVRKYDDTPEIADVAAFVEIIARNPTIDKLAVEGTPLSDAEVRALLSLPLTALAIRECRTGDTLAAPASTTLEWLSFHRTRLNDRSLESLGDLPNLKTLDLTRTRVSDDSIDYLASLPALQVLIIRRCQITDAGAKRLARLRPDLRIGWEALRN